MMLEIRQLTRVFANPNESYNVKARKSKWHGIDSTSKI